MRSSFTLGLVSALPLALGWFRWPARRKALLATPLLAYVTLAIAGYLVARFAHLPLGCYAPWSLPRGAMALIGLLVHGFCVVLPLTYVAPLVAMAPTRKLTVAACVTCAAPVVAAAWGLLLEPSRLVVRRYDVRTPRAPARPLRILHASDLQTDGRCARERRVAEEPEGADADLAVVTGDLANDLFLPDREAKIAAVNAFLRSLRARYGVFVVRGDWEGWEDEWGDIEQAMLAGTKARVLSNEAVRLVIDGTPVVIYGVEGGHAMPEPILPDLRGEAGLRMVLVHNPDLATELPPASADLVLAGHTHGGQIVLPFVGALVTHSVRGFVGGRYELDGVPLVISRGIGMRGGPAPRVRIGCPPEIGVIVVSRGGS